LIKNTDKSIISGDDLVIDVCLCSSPISFLISFFNSWREIDFGLQKCLEWNLLMMKKSAHWFCCFEVLENVLISSNWMSYRWKTTTFTKWSFIDRFQWRTRSTRCLREKKTCHSHARDCYPKKRIF
jgi:hypothetical protein